MGNLEKPELMVPDDGEADSFFASQESVQNTFQLYSRRVRMSDYWGSQAEFALVCTLYRVHHQVLQCHTLATRENVDLSRKWHFSIGGAPALPQDDEQF